MNLKRIFFLILFIGSPYFCFASGNNVIPFLLLEISLIISFVIFMFIVKMNKKAKMFLALTFVISNVIAYFIIYDLPYSKNIFFINLFTIGFPILSVFICYFILDKYCSVSKS
jgi:hypothetical protein